MNKKEKEVKIEENKVRKYYLIKQVEWINYFNNELTIESINNNLNNCSNKNIVKNHLMHKKKYIYTNNKSKRENIYIFEEDNFYIHNNNKLKTIKINKVKFRNEDKKNFFMLEKEEGLIKKEIIEKQSKNNDNSNYLNKAGYTNKKQSKNNKKNNLKYKKYKYLSYAKRHKVQKESKNNHYFLLNKGKELFMKNNILIERTLPEIYVLNNNGLLNDDDYELYKRITIENKG